MRKVFFFLLLLPNLLLSQSTGILFTDFSSNVAGFEDDSYRKALESLIGELDYSVTCVNRDSVSAVLKLIQKEENLRSDFNNPQIKNILSSANVDYVGYGNFKKFFGGKIDFQLEFVKTSGKNVLSSETFIKTFKEDDLIETSNFTDSMRTVIKGVIFTAEHGLIEKGFVEDVSEQLKIKDDEISLLNNELNLSKEKIESLNFNINELNDEINSNKFRELNKFQRDVIKYSVQYNRSELENMIFQFSYEPKVHPELRKFVYQLEEVFKENGLKTILPEAAGLAHYLMGDAPPILVSISEKNKDLLANLMSILDGAILPNERYASEIWVEDAKIRLHFFGIPKFEKNGKVFIE